MHRNWGVGLSLGIAVVAALLFFGSVLLHELAHSVTAQAQGVPVHNITLFLFGGVSNIQRDPDSPGSEFVMAILGPLTSIVLGVALMLLTSAGVGPISTAIRNPSGALADLNPLATLLLWLGSVNVAVGAFNLIPGFPLDGGRILRSILWAIQGNLKRATRQAALVGQGIAWLFIMGGIAMAFGISLPFFGSGFLNGLWLAFIGWFLNSASIQSYQQVNIQDVLEGVPVERIMRRDPPTVAADVSVENLIHDHILGSDDQAFPVLQEDRLVGLVTLDDVRRVSRDHWTLTPVGSIMTPVERLVTAGEQDGVAEALKKLAARDIRQLPVVDGDRLLGLLRRRDIVMWLHLHSEPGPS
jgi:Zn-dependent protease